MALFDLAGRRWLLRLVWELSQASGPLTFRALRDRSEGVSSSVLTRRLGELRDARLVARAEHGYALTDLGQGLVESMGPLLEWCRTWARDLEIDDAERHALGAQARSASRRPG